MSYFFSYQDNKMTLLLILTFFKGMVGSVGGIRRGPVFSGDKQNTTINSLFRYHYNEFTIYVVTQNYSKPFNFLLLQSDALKCCM